VAKKVLEMDHEKHAPIIHTQHAFEPPKPPFEDEGQTFLDLMNPQSALSDDLLDMFKKMVADDEKYRQRLERHYKMWKSVVDDPSHPDHAKVRSEFHDDPDFEPAFPRQDTVRRDGPKVGLNDPCPCGSGKKFKKCCRQ
jgi:preprotein translocase subunit SecA